jgi:hypothetical protein
MVAKSTKKELHKFKEEIAAVTNVVEKKAEEVVAEVRVVKTRKKVKK